jgi:RNA polymerase sigma factor (sigma-70 family)
MGQKKDYLIRVAGSLVPVTEEVYLEYHRMGRRERYLEESDTVHGKILYSDMDTDETLGEEAIPDKETKSVEQTVVDLMMKETLHRCLELLTDNEKALAVLMYFSNDGAGMTQREAAAALGISQPAVKKRHDKLIGKLRNYIKI